MNRAESILLKIKNEVNTHDKLKAEKKHAKARVVMDNIIKLKNQLLSLGKRYTIVKVEGVMEETIHYDNPRVIRAHPFIVYFSDVTEDEIPYILTGNLPKNYTIQNYTIEGLPTSITWKNK